jgi:hypothetical protein
MNPMDMMKLAGMWAGFKERHPKIPKFFRRVFEADMLKEGAVLELTVKGPDGQVMTANMKILPEDMELLKQVADRG